jgi:hypothetical protein
MILRCSQCRSKFQVDDGLRGKTFRCRVCSTPIKATAEFAVENASAERRNSASSAAPAARTSNRPSRSASAAPKSKSGHAAVVRQRDDERSKRDLFGQEIQLSAKVVEHQGAASPFTAARSENSVLFSLDQLSKPQLPETASAAPVRAKADSGLIDLNALMNDQPLDPKSIRPAPLSEPPLGAFTREVQPTPAAAFEITPQFHGSKKRSRLFAAVGALAVAALVTIGVVATNHEDARVAAAAQAAAPKPAEPPPAPVVKETPPPAPTAETKAQAPAETASTSDTGHRASKGRKAGKSKGSSASASAPAAPAPKKAADPCGCHGDLLCNMKCSSH